MRFRQPKQVLVRPLAGPALIGRKQSDCAAVVTLVVARDRLKQNGFGEAGRIGKVLRIFGELLFRPVPDFGAEGLLGGIERPALARSGSAKSIVGASQQSQA